MHYPSSPLPFLSYQASILGYSSEERVGSNLPTHRCLLFDHERLHSTMEFSYLSVSLPRHEPSILVYTPEEPVGNV